MDSKQVSPSANHKVSIQVRVRAADLPLSCPLPSMSMWDMHPKVYLAMDQHNQAKCPYCGANYVFIDE